MFVFLTTVALFVGVVKTETTVAHAQHYDVIHSELFDRCNVSLPTVLSHTVTHITYQSIEEGPTLCSYSFTTDHDQIVLTFTPFYHLTHEQNLDDDVLFHQYTTELSESCNDTESYIHIGHDLKNSNVKSWSSFLFCGDHHPPQFVSANQTAWVDVYHPNNISIDFQVEVLPKVTCSPEDRFQCSPVECVPKEHICDGVYQCSNDMDEYCESHRDNMIQVLSHGGVAGCFKCDDGQCIMPRASIYDVTEEGIKREIYWWFCDGYTHCLDGSDEHSNTCRDVVSRADVLFACLAIDSMTSLDIIHIPKREVCDGIQHCDDYDDEVHCRPPKVADFTALPPVSFPVCFLCRNSECIQPLWSMYTESSSRPPYGDELWWLCDGYSHCSDGTDEPKDLCTASVNRSALLHTCVPKSLLTNNHRVHLLPIAVCDDMVDCQYAADPLHCSSILDDRCNVTLSSVPQHTVTHITYQSTKEGPTLCYYAFTTDNKQIVITFPLYDNLYHQYSTQLPESCNDTESYIHIGHDIGHDLDKVDVKSWSSFLFCGDHYPPQFVSVNQTAWVVVYHPNNISVDFQVKALPKVQCSNKDEFQCSSVECIPRKQICDGTEDCSNGMEEYCESIWENIVTIATHSGAEGCYECDDGHCIMPMASAFDVTGEGIKRESNWWFCDGYAHCLDGSDEHSDTCRDLQSRADVLFLCNRIGGSTLDVIHIPKRKVCDGIQHCDSYDDEVHCPPPKVTDFTALSPVSLPVCFLCHNGECIQPLWSVYPEGFSRPPNDDEFWWLCDGYPHCSDRTDEQHDICTTFSNRSALLFSCIPKSPSTNNHTVHLLQASVCDDNVDCLYADDELYCPSLFDRHNFPIWAVCLISFVLLLCAGVVVFVLYKKGVFPDLRRLYHGIRKALGYPVAEDEELMLQDRQDPEASGSASDTAGGHEDTPV